MASFTRDATKPNGRVAQIGDNDSGRFLKLVPPLRRMTASEARSRYRNLDGVGTDQPAAEYWLDGTLDHHDLPDIIDALLDGRDPHGAEGALARALVRDARLPCDSSLADAPGQVRIGDEETHARLAAAREAAPADHRRVVRIAVAGASLRDGLTVRAYPNFGLWLLRSRRVWLAIHCGPVGQQGFGGHAHHDQLAIELSVDGEDWLRDPGTYLYTPAPERRNAYRASTAHAGPRLLDREPGPLGPELFLLRSGMEGRCLAFSERGFAGEVRLPRGGTIHGMVEVEDNALIVSHWTTGVPLAPPHGEVGDWHVLQPLVPFSPGYGYVERA
jgi:hypothetical protein